MKNRPAVGGVFSVIKFIAWFIAVDSIFNILAIVLNLYEATYGIVGGLLNLIILTICLKLIPINMDCTDSNGKVTTNRISLGEALTWVDSTSPRNFAILVAFGTLVLRVVIL
jgi:hypothetical protein